MSVGTGWRGAVVLRGIAVVVSCVLGVGAGVESPVRTSAAAEADTSALCSHQLTSRTVTTGTLSVTTGYTWDGTGNQTSRTTGGEQQALTWDAEGELSGITGADTDTSNVYDASGTRLVRVEDGTVTVFLPGGQEITATDTTVSATRWYSFAGTTVAVRTGVGMAGVSSVISDHHGTPVGYVHNTSWTAPVERVRTDPFGAPRAGQEGTLAGRGFLTAPTDATGLTLLGARYYDPATGTFLSVDPILNPLNTAQFNAYVYAGNNPATWADPSGMDWWADAWNNVTGFVNTYQAEIGGFVAGVLVTGGCLAITAGAGSVGCFIAGGAAAGAVTNVWKQTQSGKPFNVASFATDTLIGGALGLLGPAAGAVGKILAPVATKAAGAVANALKPAAVAAVRTQAGAAAAAAAGAARAGVQKTTQTIAGKVNQLLGKGGCNSFVPGTLVLLANGTKTAIEDLHLGDLVLATDPTTGDTTAQPVIATITGTGDKDLVTLTITTDTGDTGQLTATAGHPFWVPDRAEWVDAGTLQPGDWLQTSTGTWVQITAAEHDHREQRVHNLTIANTHTYYAYAGDTAILTHNCAANTGTIWDDIVGTAEAIPGTGGLPKSFELVVGDSRVWVHGNVTDHLADAARSAARSGQSAEMVGLGTQQRLRSLQAAVEAATRGGVPLNQRMTVGGWELELRQRASDTLPALIHGRWVG